MNERERKRGGRERELTYYTVETRRAKGSQVIILILLIPSLHGRRGRNTLALPQAWDYCAQTLSFHPREKQYNLQVPCPQQLACPKPCVRKFQNQRLSIISTRPPPPPPNFFFSQAMCILPLLLSFTVPELPPMVKDQRIHSAHKNVSRYETETSKQLCTVYSPSETQSLQIALEFQRNIKTGKLYPPPPPTITTYPLRQNWSLGPPSDPPPHLP